MQMSTMAKQLKFSAMTVSRAASQLTELGLLQKKTVGNKKILVSEFGAKELFGRAKPFLLEPVKKCIYIDRKDVCSDMFSAGLTALSERSMLNPPAVTVLGCTCPEKEFLTRSLRLLDADRQCMVQLWRYDPRLISQEEKADIFSLTVTLMNESDERVEQCLEELLEKAW